MVDRREEIAELRAAVEEAGRAGGGCTLLSGISGVGKSTLMQAFGAEISR
ncbi:ATP-binding protein, partial [Mycobacterium sp.]